MLDELRVCNLGVIEDLTIQFGPGMTVLSGETGAGKTLIVDALSLILGARADASLIRAGSKMARVEARFHFPDQEMLICRQVSQDEPSRAYLNGSLARVSDIVDAIRDALHIYGQHEAQALLSSTIQASIFDDYCKIDYLYLNQLKHQLSTTLARLEQLGGDERARQRELDLCKLEHEELENAHLIVSDEDQRIKDEIDLLTNAQQYMEGLSNAHLLAVEGSGRESAMDLLGNAKRALGYFPYQSLAARLEELILGLREIGRDISIEIERLDSDPLKLDQLHQRLQLLNRLKKRYGDTLDEVIKYRDYLDQRITELSSYELVAREIESEIISLQAAVSEEELRIFDVRGRKSKEFSDQVRSRLQKLAMAQADFVVELGNSPIGNPVTFLFSSNPGEKLASIAKVASGGELSRIMLALRQLATSSVPTIVFDEVDAGIGGQSALAVGQALAELADKTQILVVTHLAQVAAFARNQVAISKHTVEERTVTIAKSVSSEDRVAELARMLSGHKDSEKARAHARELLHDAERMS